MVRQLVRPGLRVCSPFEEGILHAWRGRWLSIHWGGGEGGGFKGMRGDGQPARRTSNIWGQVLESRRGVHLLPSDASAPWIPPRLSAACRGGGGDQWSVPID